MLQILNDKLLINSCKTDWIVGSFKYNSKHILGGISYTFLLAYLNVLETDIDFC